jgi:Flp pilus assembly protein TadD
MKLVAIPISVLAGVAAAGALVSGCDDPPKTPPQPPMMTAMPNQKPPSEGGPQIVAPPTPPASPEAGVPEASQMNAQAMAYYNEGVLAFGNADLQGAVASFTRATQADPQAYKAHYSLGVVHERLGNTAAAAAAYQQSFTVQPEFAQGMVAYAMLQAAQNNLSEADTFLTQKRGALSKSATIAAALAEVKSLQKDSASAQTIAQEALKLDPAYSPAMMVIARDHWRGRRLDLALYALKAIIDGFGDANPPRDKNNAEAHLLKATILLEQDRRVGAMESFKKAMELRPDLVVARLRYATYQLETGNAKDAVDILEKTLKYDANNLAAHLSLGDAYRLTGDYAKAKQEFEWVKQKDGNLAQVHYNIGLLYLFAPKIEGMSPREQLDAATASLNRYKELVSKSEQSDADELLKRASLKKAELDALAAAASAAAAPPPPPPTTADPSAAPADSAAPAGSAAPAASAAPKKEEG